MNKKIGIIQSRGLGDIVIALPIAWEYHNAGHEVHWPICQEFVSSFKDVAPWVKWLPVVTDQQGLFFLDTPVKLLAKEGITDWDDILYLYQYLSSVPDKTDPDLFSMMKFDQYKYANTGVAFKKKWELDQCIKRDAAREDTLYNKLVKQPRYMVYQNHASDVSYDIDLSAVDPELQRIEITAQTDCIFDWCKLLDGAETVILIDSVFANLMDQLNLAPKADKYFMRKWNRKVDGNPVLLQEWSYLPVTAPEGTQVASLADNPPPEMMKNKVKGNAAQRLMSRLGNINN
jgi:hypothetical protein